MAIEINGMANVMPVVPEVAQGLARNQVVDGGRRPVMHIKRLCTREGLFC
jgi:hypothetical protein